MDQFLAYASFAWPILLIVPVFVLSILFQTGGGEAGLRRWATDSDFELVSIERRWLDKGPFLFRTGKNGKVYYFVARNSTGLTRNGFARVKPPFMCLFSDPVKIAWEDSDWR